MLENVEYRLKRSEEDRPSRSALILVLADRVIPLIE
jgi:hypothetical protein